MNKENAAQYLPLVQALADGKTIQVNHAFGEWIDCFEVKLAGEPENYRIKPEPRKSWYRVAEFGDHGKVWVITCCEGFPESEASRGEFFKRWLTDKIYFDVTDK